MSWEHRLSRRPTLPRLVALLGGVVAIASCLDQSPAGPVAGDLPRLLGAVASGACQTASSTWWNAAFAPQTGVFTAQFDATPSASSIDGVIGLSPSAASRTADLAALVRFNRQGTIDARNGKKYAAAMAIPYRAGETYHFRLVVDLPHHSYAAYVTPPASVEQTIGAGYAFQYEQRGATMLSNVAAFASRGSMVLCGFDLPSAPSAVVPVAAMEVTPAMATLRVGDTLRLTATPQDAGGNALTGRAVSWTSGNGTIATVNGTGLVAAKAMGNTTISATSEGVTGTAALTVGSALCTPSGAGVCRYVDPQGDDANPGTSSAPYRTPQRAAQVVNPGDVVIVRDGVYTGGTTVLDIRRSGTATDWIIFRADHKWGAVIDGRSNSSVMGADIRAAYIRVEGFEVRGTSRYGIEAYQAHDVVVAQNHVHDIGRYCTDTTGGIAGVNAYAPNLLIEQNVVHDVGRFADGENGCQPLTTYWQSHDHGVYHGIGDNVIIRNNLFYRLTHGWAIHRYDGSGTTANDVTILNNTFVGKNPNRVGQIIIATATTNLRIVNNIFYQPTTAGIWLDTPGSTGSISNNLTYGAGLTSGTTTGFVIASTLVDLDPRFMSDTSWDFHLAAGSPAIDVGLVQTYDLVDLDGLRRAAGAALNLGAYQHP